jgi:chloramphenicol-sensitive protein RarD
VLQKQLEPSPPPTAARAGLVYGLAAYLWWGFVPIYFKLVAAVPAIEVLGHRIVWSCAFLAVLIAWQRRWHEVWTAMRMGRVVGVLVASTLLVGTNWFVFIWAVEHNQVLQASLGYFINPLVSVLLGMIFLRERLRAWQAAALVLVAAGVVNLAIAHGVLPWISLVLALSFGGYGLLRKIVNVGALAGLMVETAILTPLGIWLVARGMLRDLAPITSHQAQLYGILLLAGVVTTLPLIWFTNAARRLRLATMGFLQYVGPTCQFLLAVFLFNETFTRAHGITFSCIWLAVAIYSIDSIRAYTEARRTAVQEPMNFVQD